jgi:hypothetical protein
MTGRAGCNAATQEGILSSISSRTFAAKIGWTDSHHLASSVMGLSNSSFEQRMSKVVHRTCASRIVCARVSYRRRHQIRRAFASRELNSGAGTVSLRDRDLVMRHHVALVI